MKNNKKKKKYRKNNHKAALQTAQVSFQQSLATTTSKITACATVVMGFKPGCWQTGVYKDFS